MYRDSMLGTALSATLTELQGLTETQKEQLWLLFDRSMDACLAEVPMMTRVSVRAPLPRPLVSENSTIPASGAALLQQHHQRAPPVCVTEQGTLINGHISAGASSSGGDAADAAASSPPRVAEVAEVFDDADIAFPVYRCVDGVWTLLLKDPVVEVRDEYGAEEQLKLDYLKVYLKDASAATVSKPQSKRKRARKA